MAKFIVFDVFAYVRGNVTHVATFNYANQANAQAYAKDVPGGYCVRNTITARLAPQPREQHAEPDTRAVPVPVVTVPVPVVATVYVVWDDVNERPVTGFLATGHATGELTFTTRQDAQAYADRLNTFGGYGGWMSLRFHVRER